MMTYRTGSKPEYPWDKGCQEIEKCSMAILDDDVFFHAVLFVNMCNYYRQVKVLHGKNKAETLLQDFVVSTGKCKFRLFCCRTQLLVFQTSVFLRTLCVFRDQLILFGVYCCAFVDFFSQYCCPVNFKTAEKSTPKPFSIGLRAFFFRKKAPRKTNNDGRIRRIGAGQETNGVAQSALSKEGECPFLVEEK